MNRVLILLFVCFLVNPVAFAYEWKAYWIGTDVCQSEPNTWLNFRKDFDLDTMPDKAIAHIAVDSKYWLWVNDQLVVFEGGLKRGPTPQDTYYDEVDIAPYLKNGKNVISVLVWYFGKQGFSHNSIGNSCLLFDCQMSESDILSDTSWKCALNTAYQTCSLPKPNYRLSESDILYDARYDMGGWYKTNVYVDYPSASILGKAGGSPWNKLVKRPIPLFKYSELKNYEDVYRNGDSLICVLPYNAQVTPYFKIKAPEGERLIMATDNYFSYNGDTENIRAEYVTKSGVQEYESLGWMNGHRIYYIVPKSVEVLDVKYRESGYNCEFAGHFASSDSLLNKLWQKSLRTLYVTMRDSYMDCPERERAQWAGDAVIESGESYYALCPRSHALTKKWLWELADWQKYDGTIFAPVPSGNWGLELPGQILASVGFYGAWNYYLHTGDRETLHHIYPAFKHYLDLWTENENGMLNLRNGGWLWGDWGTHCDIYLLINAWYYLALKGMRLSAIALNYKNDVDSFEQRMKSLKSAFNTVCWNGYSYRSPNYQGETDDRVQALAVVSGLADTDKYDKLLEVFKKEFHASPYMEKYVFEAMMQMGYEDEAFERHKKRMKSMVENSYFSTLFEHWNIGIDGYKSGSVNHAWTGGGLTVLSEYLCGIAPLAPGYEKVSIIPQPGSIDKASAEVSSVKGMISSSFIQDNKGLNMEIQTPCGIPTVVGIPREGVSEIWMNDCLVWKRGKYRHADGIEQYHDDNLKYHILFLVKGGHFNFKSIK